MFRLSRLCRLCSHFSHQFRLTATSLCSASLEGTTVLPSRLCARFRLCTDGRPSTHAISIPSPAPRLAHLHTILTRGSMASSLGPVLLSTVCATRGSARPDKPQLKPYSKGPQSRYSKFPSILQMRTPQRACLPEIWPFDPDLFH